MNTSAMMPALREKWATVPAGGDQRASSREMLKLSDAEIAERWDAVHHRDTIGDGLGSGRNVRGWYHDAYRDFVRGKRLLDIGCGFGVSSIAFALMGARVTFTDIVESNVDLCRAVCRAKGVDADFRYIESFDTYDSLGDFDVVFACGSLHHQPFEDTRTEISRILPHLVPGGTWLHFTYPKARWIKEGSPSFSDWGPITDGEGTPWAEWYDVQKLALFAPTPMQLVFDCEWHDSDFNWFELRRGA